MTAPEPTIARRPAPLRGVAALLASIVFVPIVAYALWDFIESERLAGRLDGIYPWVETSDGRQPPGDPPSPDEEAATALYLGAAHQTDQSGGRPFLESARIIEALEALPSAEARRDPRLDELRQAEAPYAQALDQLDRAAARTSIPQIADLRLLDARRLASINAIRIARLALSGDPGAATALASTLRLNRTATSQWFLLRTVHSLRLVLEFAHPSEATLARLEAEYVASEPVHGLEDQLEQLRNQIVRAGAPEDFGTSMPRAKGPLDAVAFRLSRPLRNHALSAELDRFSSALEAARLPFPKNVEAAARIARELGLPRPFSPRRFTYLDTVSPWRDAAMNELVRMAPLVAENLALARASIAALAIERYRLAHGGSPPDALGQLVPAYLGSPLADPFTGSELRYRHDGRGYAVYSDGANRKDDGGVWEIVSDLQLTRRGYPKDVGIAVRISPMR